MVGGGRWGQKGKRSKGYEQTSPRTIVLSRRGRLGKDLPQPCNLEEDGEDKHLQK